MNEIFGKKLCSKTGGAAFSLNVFIYFAISLVASLIISALNLTAQNDVFIYINYLVSPVAMIISVLITKAFGNFKYGEIIKLKCKPKYYLIALLLVFGLMFALGWTNDLTVEFLQLFGYVPRENQSYLPDVSGVKIIPALIVIAVIPAFLEELFFRGLLLNSTEEGAGSVRTIFIVGFCFALYHGSPEQTVYQFICGCAFALIAVRSGSLLPSVLMHFINNAFIVIGYSTGLITESGYVNFSPTFQVVITVLSAISFVGALVWLILDKTQLKKTEKAGVKTFFKFASVGIAILSLVWILNLFGVS